MLSGARFKCEEAAVYGRNVKKTPCRKILRFEDLTVVTIKTKTLHIKLA
jgi:hypothetical protein